MRFRLTIFLLLLLSLPAFSQTKEGPLDKSQPKGMTVDDVIRRFTTKEKQWKQMREQYTFRQTIRVEAFNGDESMGEYRNVADISYQGGKQIKSVVFSPQSGIDMSKEDLQDVETRASFTISTDELPEYNLTYVGQQQEDELHCYVFDVAPKTMLKDKRYFQGRIWVDDQDFQIVKDNGKSVPDIRIVKKKKVQENLFPKFTTWRQLIDGYWFPAFSSVDDTLHFQNGDVRIKQVLKFENYHKTGS